MIAPSPAPNGPGWADSADRADPDRPCARADHPPPAAPPIAGSAHRSHEGDVTRENSGRTGELGGTLLALATSRSPPPCGLDCVHVSDHGAIPASATCGQGPDPGDAG